MQALLASPRWVSAAEVAGVTGLSVSRSKRMLYRLMAAGVVGRCVELRTFQGEHYARSTPLFGLRERMPATPYPAWLDPRPSLSVYAVSVLRRAVDADHDDD